ncbi:MAG: hypothetical protein U0324_37985 [Polyangiales bacterium]
MAKAPKAPGKNGASTPDVIFDALDEKTRAVGDGYWRGRTQLGALVSATKLFGAAKVAPWRDALREVPPWHAEALAKIAEGTARRGATAESDAAVVACREALEDPAVDGEDGTRAWCAFACAMRARGDERGVDAALKEAVACARRDKVNPTQPWPHLVLAYRLLERDEALLAHYAKVKDAHLVFEDMESARAVVSRAIERGDVAGYRKWRGALERFNGYETYEALMRSALPAAGAGHGEALLEMMRDFAGNESYGDYAASAVCTALAGGGFLPLARRVVTATRERFPRALERLDTLARDLGSGDDLAAQRAYFRETEAAHPDGQGEPFVQAFRARHAVDRESALRLADVREAALRAELGSATALTGQALVSLGVALASVGENPRGVALVDEAVKLCAGLKGRDKASSLEYVGPMLTGHGLDEQALTVLRKMTSKYHRTTLSKHLSLNYVRAGDHLGAVMVVGLGDERPLSQAMRLADALAEAAGVRREFENFA